MPDLTGQDLGRLRDLITRYSGLGGFLQADDTLQRAITLRLAACGLGDLSEYWPLLQQPQSQEMDHLVQLITNKETFFFREMHHFDLLRDRILPELLAARKYHARPDHLLESSERAERQPLRFWSAGCSSGEEAYSLAIVLLEFQKRYGKLEAEVIGTDIDASALETARRGQYGERSIRLVPASILRQYFTFDRLTFRVSPAVAQLVRFRLHNLAEEHFPPELGDMDVIFCRNVTTFFDPAARDRLNTRLADALREGGYLFVASTEAMGHNRGLLELFPVGRTFLFRKRSSADELAAGPALSSAIIGQATSSSLRESAAHAALNPRPLGAYRPASTAADSPPPETWLYRARVAFHRQDYAAVLSALDRIPSAEPVLLEAYSLRAAALIQQGHLPEAEAACQYLLAHNPWDVDAHFLMGLIAYRQGQPQAAAQSLKTAIYFQPEHRWARFYLAEAYRALGQNDNARREYRYTLNILRAVRPPDRASDLYAGLVDDDTLRQACQANLARPA